MRRRRLQSVALVLGLLLAGTTVCAAGPEQGDVSAYELCIEHSPVKAGTVTPNVGMHHFSANSVVTLSADPRPGYQFAYWIGDVCNPKSRQTTVRVDAAKIVVAVFRSVQDDGMERKLSVGGAGGGTTRLVPSMVNLKSPGFSVSTGGASTTVAVPVATPVVPTPEPTTIALLGLGALALRRRQRQ